MAPTDVGTETTRRVDRGPWRLSPTLRARHAPGATLGSIVVHWASPYGGVLFSGRVLGFDARADEVSGFGLELDHDSEVHSKTLAALAELPADWDFEWLLPSRGSPVRFRDAQDARDAIRFAKQRVDLVSKGVPFANNNNS